MGSATSRAEASRHPLQAGAGESGGVSAVRSFSSQTARTRSELLAWLAQDLDGDLHAACQRIKRVLVHPVDARRLRVPARRGRLSSKLDHAKHATVLSVLSDERLAEARKRHPANVEPAQRLVLSCDHHALLLTGLMRHLGFPTRMRAGWANYLVKGRFIPHWLTEVHNGTRWVLVDPDRCIVDVHPDRVIIAGTRWLEARAANAAKPSATFSGMTGWSALKYALLSDVTALLGAELVGYDWRLSDNPTPKPAIASAGFRRLTNSQLQGLDDAASRAQLGDVELAGLNAVAKQLGLQL